MDKYGEADYVINEDIIDFNPSKRYDLIICISTLEHVGWDEPVREPDKIFPAIENLKNLLSSTGTLIVTIPVNWNPYLDESLKNGKIKFSEQYYLKKISKKNYKWAQSTLEDTFYETYGPSPWGANGLFIGIENKNPSLNINETTKLIDSEFINLFNTELGNPIVHVQHIFNNNFVVYENILLNIGLITYEIDSSNIHNVNNYDKMDEIWVLTDSNIQRLIESGINFHKIFKIPITSEYSNERQNYPAQLIVERINYMHDLLGIDHILLQIEFGSQPFEVSKQTLELFIEQVIPKLTRISFDSEGLYEKKLG